MDRANFLGDLALCIKILLRADRHQDMAAVAGSDRDLSRMADTVRRAAVSTDSLGSMVDFGRAAEGFLGHLRTSVIDMPGWRLAEANVPLIIGAAGIAGLIQEYARLPVLSSVSRKSLTLKKTGGLCVFLRSQVESNSPEAESFMAKMTRQVTAESSNKALVQSLELDSNTILINSSGATPQNILTDIAAGIATMSPTPGSRFYLLATPRAVASLATKNVSGQLAFPNVSPSAGGELLAHVTVVPTAAVPDADTNGEFAILIDADAFLLNRGQVYFDKSDAASIEMSDDPDGNGEVVNLFQIDAVGLRIVRRFGIEPIRQGVAIIGHVEW